MCGICGAVAGSVIVSNEIEKLQKLLILNGFRGDDSTGMMDFIEVKEKTRKFFKKKKETVVETPEWAHWKEVIEPYIFATRVIPQVQATRWQPNMLKMVVCHARAATAGKVTKENAHPFRYRNIVGVHNGTIYGDFDGRSECDVDSQALIMNIQKLGAKKAIEHITEKATSIAYAVVYMDLDKKTLNVMRNNARPLHYYSQAGVTYLSSDKKDLAYTFNVSMAHVDLKEFKPEVLYTLDLTKSYARFEEEDMDIPRKVYPVVNRSYDDRFGTWDTENNCWVDHPKRHDRGQVGMPWRDDHKVLPLLGQPDKLEQERNKESYLRSWADETWEGWVNRSQKSRTQAWDWYDIAFDAYFSEYMMKMLVFWRSDPQHRDLYNQRFREKWDKLNPVMKRVMFDKCKIKPANITSDPGTGELTLVSFTSALLPDPKESLTVPFGVSGKKCSPEMYAKKLDNGCVACDKDVDLEEQIFWVNDKDFICDACQWSAMGDAKHIVHQFCDVRKIEAFLDAQTKVIN